MLGKQGSLAPCVELCTSKYGNCEVTAYCQFVNTKVSSPTRYQHKRHHGKKVSLAPCVELAIYLSVGGSPFSRCNMETVSVRGG